MKNKIINISLVVACSVTIFNGANANCHSLSMQKMCGNGLPMINVSKYRPHKICKKSILASENILSEPEKVRQEFIQKIDNIEYSDRKSWFISYKNVIEKYMEYAEYINIPDSVYRHYNYGQLNVFQKLVAAEAGGGSFESKCNVASVIWNRLKSPKYPNDIVSVIYERNGSPQFTPTYDGRINSVEVTEEEILAVEYTYMFGSTAYDCIAFDKVNGGSWNKNHLEAVFTDSIGHTFYR